jgi:hypothetical protein
MSEHSPVYGKVVEFRPISHVVLLSAVTLLIGYPIYLCYRWARELNGLLRERRYSPQVVLLLSIVTLGLAAIAYECLFAQELEQHFREGGRPDALPHLSGWVIGMNVLAVVSSFTVVGVVVAIPCGMVATCLIQAELNKLAVGAPSAVI